ncbi:MAG: sigma-54 dependent transcriptional regulator [Bacteroidetes bacterium]|nr:sigma-54 dependent transcriptional regulator [Bacteroidota bacterium]
MPKGRVLIADDEQTLCISLKNLLTEAGYTPEIARNRVEFFTKLGAVNPDVVLLDVYLGDDNGIDILRQMKTDGWNTPVIVMTAHSEIAIAVRAMKEGAVEFLEKPFDTDYLFLLIERTLEFVHLESRVKLLQEELEEQWAKSGIIGKSRSLRRTLEIAERFAQSDSTTILIEGESGVGKELLARYIHQKSIRSDKPFIAFNCAAIPKDLAESEFFGYERGAFTGAVEKMKQGKFELANGGTILLDEIGELSLDMQVKLLRVLEEKKFYRLGGTRELSIDVRIIAATNRSLAKETEAGRFREDLFYRLNVATIHIPPLRERKEDIQPLVLAFAHEFAQKFNKPTPKVSSDAIQYLSDLPWKGNIRELRNCIERVVLLHDVPVLTSEHFAFMQGGTKAEVHSVHFGNDTYYLQVPKKGVKMNDVLKDLILKTLELTGGNQVQAAKVLGITRAKLRYKMEQLGIKPEMRTYKTQ